MNICLLCDVWCFSNGWLRIHYQIDILIDSTLLLFVIVMRLLYLVVNVEQSTQSAITTTLTACCPVDFKLSHVLFYTVSVLFLSQKHYLVRASSLCTGGCI